MATTITCDRCGKHIGNTGAKGVTLARNWSLDKTSIISISGIGDYCEKCLQAIRAVMLSDAEGDDMSDQSRVWVEDDMHDMARRVATRTVEALEASDPVFQYLPLNQIHAAITKEAESILLTVLRHERVFPATKDGMSLGQK